MRSFAFAQDDKINLVQMTMKMISMIMWLVEMTTK
jgi:hypothetical protein